MTMAEQSPGMHSLSVQIDEVEREISMRRYVYQKQVARKAMRQGEADEKIKRMESVLATLRWVKEDQEKTP
jgi:hypothetical protein